MFGKSKPNPKRAESRYADETFVSATRLSRADPMAEVFASGLRIRTGLNA
jgi:hypothetical protein